MGMIRHGVHRALEDEADRLIRESLVGVTSQSAKRDILTPWKMKDRLEREVYSSSGSPDASTRSGMYNRAWNPAAPHLNSRDGVTRGRRTDSMRSFAEEQGGVYDPGMDRE